MSAKSDGLSAKLEELVGRYDEIGRKIGEPSVAADANRVIALSKEQSKLKLMLKKHLSHNL